MSDADNQTGGSGDPDYDQKPSSDPNSDQSSDVDSDNDNDVMTEDDLPSGG